MTPEQLQALDAIVVAERVLRASLTAAPPPVDPPVEPPPVSNVPTLIARAIVDPARVVCFSDWYGSNGLYQRYQALTLWTGASGSVVVRRKSLKSGTPDTLPEHVCTLVVDGKRIPVTFASGQDSAKVVVPLDGMAEGWHMLDVEDLLPGETCVPWFAYRYIDGTHKPATMPVVMGSHGMAYIWRPGTKAAWAWVPASYTPKPAPLPFHAFEAISPTTGIRGTLMAPTDMGADITTPNFTRAGVVNTMGMQAYFWADVRQPYPTIPLIDGPRGVAQTGMVLEIQCATDAPGPVPRDVEAYFLTPWSFGKVSRSGALTTLAGYVHEGIASNWQDQGNGATLKMRGDWSAVPAARRGFRDPWGIAWLQVEIDQNAPPNPAEGNLQPHILPPIALIADAGSYTPSTTGVGRILALRFSATQHAPEPVVTEWMTGLHDPFGLAMWNGELLISERSAHRIIAVDPQTKAAKRVIVERDPALPGNATMHPYRVMSHDTSTLAERRAQPCLGPEALRVFGDWLYYGSFAAECIKRVHLVTGVVEWVMPVLMDRQSNFVQFDICKDDSFAPAGTIFVNHWGQSNTAKHYGTKPDGSHWIQHRTQAPWDDPQAYSAGVGVGRGRMYIGGSSMGITRFAAGEPIDSARYVRGRAAFDAAGGRLLYGPGGFSPHGVALPWGQSPDLDYYLNAHNLPGNPAQGV